MAMCQFAVMLDVPASSRASPLPQEERGPHQEPGRLSGRLAEDVIWGAPLTMCSVHTHFSKVSRCKSETVSSRYLNNGYTYKNTCAPQSVIPRLRSLAPLPTTTRGSTGLWALAPGSNVCRSLPVQRSGLAARHNIKARRSALWRLCVGHFGAPGSLIPGLLTRVLPPPFSFSSDVWRLHQSGSVNNVQGHTQPTRTRNRPHCWLTSAKTWPQPMPWSATLRST